MVDFCSPKASPLRNSAPDNLRRSGSFGKSGRGLHLAASFESKSGYVHKYLHFNLSLSGTAVVIAFLT